MADAPLITMMRAFLVAAGAMLCLLLGIGNVNAYSGFGTAVIEDREGIPCFGLPPRALEWVRSPRILQAVMVYHHDTVKAWSFMYDLTPAEPLAPGQCIVYGDLPASATLRTSPQPLIPATLYEVYLNAPTNGPIRGYTAKFCLKAAPDGSTRVIPVRHDAQKGWSADACQS
ncbi:MULTISPECIES: hypothetical protein [Stenotrophomonas]|jgi:hypothetical protein|uniref:Uncharacterized protein n=2 Tax=Stenotrophomonas maltophilia group TaxID=995085 RepID=A0A270NJ29_STEMA|nr:MULTISPECIES: hypothetical protein [Stenotrophomonas]AYA89929.1 hypothetical protein PEM_03890 [Stenotrophomonas sp. Pemsol]EMI50987.1 hypothetical protein C405_03787 [Stenotrophomonas maltophilia AU12-09]MBH1587441.1 hypothetical protein [Stenotrophomonas maltophilia]MBN4957831.1 hypothetical protein [Stenotrophomonas maltophilia]MBN4968539.1 hypothetical protein [Stenotrophomonas maltophilia]